VVDLPALLWQPVLHCIVLRSRPASSAHAYAQIWTEEGSPLAAITAAQTRELQARLGENVRVGWGMRYGNPALGDELARLVAEGCTRVLFAPLYPQYSTATTASAEDALEAALRKLPACPELRRLPPYFDDPAHIAALRADIARQLDALAFAPKCCC